MDDGWGKLAERRKSCPAPPGLLTPTSNYWKTLSRDDEEPEEPNQHGYRSDDDDDYDQVPYTAAFPVLGKQEPANRKGEHSSTYNSVRSIA